MTKWFRVGVENIIVTDHWVQAEGPEHAEREAARLGRADVPLSDHQRTEILETYDDEDPTYAETEE